MKEFCDNLNERLIFASALDDSPFANDLSKIHETDFLSFTFFPDEAVEKDNEHLKIIRYSIMSLV